MPRSTLIYPIPSVAHRLASTAWRSLRSLLSLRKRARHLRTLTPTSGRYPIFTGLMMSARITIIEKKTRTAKMEKLTGSSLR